MSLLCRKLFIGRDVRGGCSFKEVPKSVMTGEIVMAGLTEGIII